MGRLELVEWLDGNQMGPAKGREWQREQIHRVLAHDWENRYMPRHFRGAFPLPRGTERIERGDEHSLREQFFACAADVDRNWSAKAESCGNSYLETDLCAYPLLKKYFSAIRYIGGEPHGFCWIGEQGDGGAFDPNAVVEALKSALESKLSHYSTPDKQAHLKAQGLTELNLLVHGGFNAYAYNTPSGHLSLAQIARRGADHYAALAQRQTFKQVWFFHSLDPADELNQLLGFSSGAGRVRWLAQLWPDFNIYPGSVAG